MHVWLNGMVVPVEDARISVLDHGLTVGDGAFETLKIVDGIPFAATRHIRRLARSAQALALPAPDPGLVAAAMRETVRANLDTLGEHGRLRVTYTSGEGPPGSDRGPGPCTLIAYAVPGVPWPATTSVITVPWPRNERGALAGVKSTSYAENAVALAEAARHGASEAVVLNTQGQLCEGTGSNVFLVKSGAVSTPALDSGCLAGITRELVLEWFEVRETTLTLADLMAADEVFLTSSTRDVHPVDRIDGRTLERWPISAQLAEDFRRRAQQDLDP